MKEYIECITKHRAKHFVCEFCNEHCSDEPCEPSDCEWMQYIENEPAADVVERKRGEWIGEADGYADGELVYDVWYCSECNHCIDDGTDDPDLLPNFCPNCGSDMRGVDHDKLQ